MNKLFFILFFVFSFNFCFSQTYTEKWNEYKKQYEYFDSNGNMIAYKVYNSYRKQWETYTVQNNTNQNKSSINLELTRKVLAEKQAKYDTNILKVRNQISIVFQNIDYLVLKLMTNSPQELDYKFASHLKALFQEEYVKTVENKDYDYSHNSITEQILSYLKNGSISIVRRELDFIENKTYYQYLVNEFSKM